MRATHAINNIYKLINCMNVYGYIGERVNMIIDSEYPCVTNNGKTLQLFSQFKYRKHVLN